MGRSWRLVAVSGAAVVAAAAAAVAGIAVNVATGGMAPWLPSMDQHPLWWLAGATSAVAASGLLGWWAQRRYERGLVALVPVAQRSESWVLDRPVEVGQIVRALRRGRGAATVGITTAVYGAGGFGKTTVARLVRADRRVLGRFGGRVYWVTLGRDARRGALVEKVNDLVRQVDPGRAQPFTDVRQAAAHLAAVLAEGPRRLVVLDDVWFDDQLAAFPVAGRCARLVTTRVASLVAGQLVPVKVDQMSREQARSVLTAGLHPVPPPVIVDGLVVECGRWPLLLRLVNKIMVDQVRSRTDVAAVAQELLHQLRHGGAMQVDQLTGAVVRDLDINDPEQRDQAVAATIEASTGLLRADEYARFTELAIFVEDETIPVALVAMLWQRTGGLSSVASRALCARLADLALLTLTATGEGGTIGLHDVIGDYLHQHLGAAKLTGLHQVLLDAAAADLPHAAPAVGVQGRVVAWWELPESARYLREHLVEHLRAADRGPDAEALATDLRWVQARLDDTGPLGPFADLALIDTPRAARLSRVLGQTAHLLTPTEPAHCLVDILYARVAHDPDWGRQARTLASRRTLPALTSTWPLPDLPPAALRRTLTGHTSGVGAVAIAPDGTWLASASRDGSVRIWDAVTGTQRAKLTGHTSGVWAVAIAPDGRWLASASIDGSVRIWDAVTGTQHAELTGHTNWVSAVAIAADGRWLASASDGSVRIWDAVTGTQRTELTGHTRSVRAVAIAPDGRWLASASADGSVRIWDAVTGTPRAELTGHNDWVSAVAIAPDGTWLASAGIDRSVRIWDAVTGTQRTKLTGHTGGVNAVAIAADGRWLASAGNDGSVRIWDVASGNLRTELTGHTNWVSAVAIAPDGTWLASASADESVRIWDAATGHCCAMMRTEKSLTACAWDPLGRALIIAGDAGLYRFEFTPQGS